MRGRYGADMHQYHAKGPEQWSSPTAPYKSLRVEFLLMQVRCRHVGCRGVWAPPPASLCCVVCVRG